MVGSCSTKRVSSVYGVSFKNGYEQNNFTITYDQLSKKIGSGMGGYVNCGYIPTQSGASKSYLAPYSQQKSHYINCGISFAPKYNFMKKSNPDEIRFTWSPSISFNYSNFYNHNRVFVPDNNTDDLLPRIHNYYNLDHSTELTLGGLLNNKSLLLGLTLSYFSTHTDTKIDYNDFNNTSYQASVKEPRDGTKTNVLLGVVFPKNENSDFGGSVIFRYGLYHKVGAINNTESRRGVDNSYLGFNLRFKRILLGICTTAFKRIHSYDYNDRTFYPGNSTFYMGYKSKQWKVTISTTRYKNFIDQTHKLAFGETTFSYTFK